MARPTVDEAVLFHAARQIQARDARRLYLHEACGDDPKLRARVEALLRVYDEERSFLESPVVVRPDAVAVVSERPGMAVGPYHLVEQIGEGGFGVVFRAEQQQPIRRSVALKLLKPGMDTQQVVARFEAERQALALMDHPNIARVLDSGETASGRPYFVMELVQGVPLTRSCDEQQLPLRERLRVFMAVCRAVQHAHQKGIIHRDLKPSNVLVTTYDGQPVPKVIDFGVAKALGQRLTERTLVTGLGSIVGTLEYMSPEQAEFNALDIDTRADIYSLGVLLYELLTGTTPLTRERLQQVPLTEAFHLIRDEEPPRPSARLSASKDTLIAISAKRQREPARLTREVRGELDWIVMKALEKDRNRRYQTANGFERDLERYLNEEPVEACPPSAVYRLRKFARKNRKWLAAAAVFALLLATGAGVSSWQAVRAWAAEHQALAALEGEAAQRHRAQESEAQTQAVLDFMEQKVFAAARPKGLSGGLGRDVTLRQAVEAALPVVDKSFANQPLTEARLRLSLGHSFYFLGEGQLAADHYERAHALYLEHLGPDHADTVESIQKLATSYEALGRHADALKLREETLARQKLGLGLDHADTLDSLNNLAISYEAHGRHVDALKLREEVLALRKAKLGPDHPDTLGSMNNLVITYAVLGRLQEALKLCEQTLTLYKAKLGPDHPDTLMSMNNLANCYDDLGQYADALKLREEVLPHLKVTLSPGHPQTLWGMHNLANSYAKRDRHAEALKLREETLALRESKLGLTHPDTLRSLKALAESLVQFDRGPEAVSVIDECVRRSAGQVVHPKLIPGVMDLRLRYFEKAKDAEGCRATAELWEKQQRTDAASLYQAACCRAVTAAVLRAMATSPAAVQQADAEADRAMTWLRQAMAAGYKDVAKLKQAKDFDALRERADFQQVLAELKEL